MTDTIRFTVEARVDHTEGERTPPGAIENEIRNWLECANEMTIVTTGDEESSVYSVTSWIVTPTTSTPSNQALSPEWGATS